MEFVSVYLHITSHPEVRVSPSRGASQEEKTKTLVARFQEEPACLDQEYQTHQCYQAHQCCQAHQTSMFLGHQGH